MTAAIADTANIAEGSSQVGVQGTVHGNVTVYQVPPDATPDELYRVGLAYLDGGMPTKASELIDQAIVRGHTTGEVWFHWLLALLSDRTLQQFTTADFTRLRSALGRLPLDLGDSWSDGLKTIIGLLDTVEKPESDIRLSVKQLDELPDQQRTKILRHLAMFLKGPVEDEMWRRDLERVRDEQMAHSRTSRVWMFFQPEPAPPRVRTVRQPIIRAAERVRCLVALGACVMAVGYLAWILLFSMRLVGLTALLVSAAGAYLLGVNGLIWRERAERLRMKDRDFQPGQHRPVPPRRGFADKVDRLFDRYFTKYSAGPGWHVAVAGVRQYLRDEVVEVYRESRVKSDAIAWLVRHHARDTRRRWLAGTLFAYRVELRTPLSVRAACVLGGVLLALGGLVAVVDAALTSPLPAMTATLVALAGGWTAGTTWLQMIMRARHFQTERQEAAQRLADLDNEYRRWCNKLAAKPSDAQMAAWLDCDRKVLMDRAMRHYELRRSGLIAYAYLETPTAPYRSARVRNGPWRYSRYRQTIFLLTRDGVRQFTADLNVAEGTFHNAQRHNYRFEAVAAVSVTETDDHQRTFDLTLVSQQSFSMKVTGSSTEQLQIGEDAETLSKVDLDATGLIRTLHVLEGIAAEGKDWVTEEKRRKESWREDFSSAINRLLE